MAREAEHAREAFEQSVALMGNKASVISELWSIAGECEKPDWDGYGAAAIDRASVRVAEQIIRALPNDVAMPEVTPEPDGHISLDWIVSPHRVLSVSASPNGRLAVAWLNGSNRGHMVERFDGERIPAKILTLIHEITQG
ncbi:MAG: hypothetical protein ACIAS6_00625 [Phycisphaerales bacterium JB060]